MRRDGVKLLSYEEREKIEQYLKEGMNAYEISKKLGRCSAGIRKEIMLCGGYDVYTAQSAEERRQKIIGKMREQHTKNLSREQIEIIERGVKEGLPILGIARMAKVNKSRLRRFLPKIDLSTSILDRVSALEMQLEIVIQQLKELYGKTTKNN